MTPSISAMPKHDPPPDPSEMPHERVLVAGLGRAGLDYACTFATHSGSRLAGFVESRNELRRFARGIGFQAPSDASLLRWLTRNACDAVVVAAPPAEAPELVEQAVRSGLAVLVHGLAAMPGPTAIRIRDLLAGSERPVAAGAPIMFHPLFARARRTGALSPERITQLRASASVSRVFSPLVNPGRDVLDFLLADLMLVLTASFGGVERVKATGTRLYGPWIDECQLEVRFANGLVGRVDASWSVPDYPSPAMVIECAGPDGRVIVSDDALEMDLDSLQGRVVAASEPGRVRFDSGEQAIVAEGFLALLAGDTSVVDALSVARAVHVAQVIEAARRSIAAAGESVGVES